MAIISDYPEVLTIDDDDLFLIENTDGNYKTVKKETLKNILTEEATSAVYNAEVSFGYSNVPASRSISDVVEAINTIAGFRYSEGVTATKNASWSKELKVYAGSFIKIETKDIYTLSIDPYGVGGAYALSNDPDNYSLSYFSSMVSPMIPRSTSGKPYADYLIVQADSGSGYIRVRTTCKMPLSI